MKLVANILLFLFVSFLAVPTIVTLIEKKSDVSAFYSSAEEEIHKEIKAEIKECYSFDLINYSYTSKIRIFSGYQSNLMVLTKEILIPPPKMA